MEGGIRTDTQEKRQYTSIMTMDRLLSRQEAADYLGVSRQTVSNWLESGILHDVGQKRHTLIDRKSLDGLLDTLRDLARMEENIKAAKQRTEALWKETLEKMDDVRRAHGIAYLTGEDAIRIEFLEMLIYLALDAGIISPREQRILSGIVRRKPIDGLAQEDGSGRANIMQIAHKAIRKVAGMNDYAAIRQELDVMRKKNALADQVISDQNEEIVRLKEELARYAGHKEEPVDEGDDEEILSMRQLLKTRLVDMDLSVRLLVCMKSQDIETLGDAVQYSKTDFLKFRNLGRKTLNELEELFDSLNLSFGMDVSKYLRKGAKLEYESYGSRS